jgi:hypothetical protein
MDDYLDLFSYGSSLNGYSTGRGFGNGDSEQANGFGDGFGDGKEGNGRGDGYSYPFKESIRLTSNG